MEIVYIKDLPGWGKGHAGLYFSPDDGEYMVVSTVTLGVGLSLDEEAIVGIVGMFGGYATNGEETMAFRSDEDGNVSDWGEIAVVNGSESREKLLNLLRDREPSFDRKED